MDTEKRFLLALGLTLAFLYVWSQYLVPHPSKPEPSRSTESATPTVAAPATTAGSKAPAVPPTESPVTTPKQTPLASMVWTNQPGSLEKLVLNKFHETAQKNSPNVTIIPFYGNPPPPLRWQFEVNNQTWTDDGAAYKLISSSNYSLAYERQLTPDLKVTKIFSWAQDSYLIDVKTQITNQSKQPIKLKAQTTLSSGDHAPKAGGFLSILSARETPLRLIAFINEKATHWTSSDVLSHKEIPTGAIQWAGFDTQYFLLTVVPTEGRWAELQMNADTHRDEVAGKDMIDQLHFSMLYPAWDIPAGTSQTYSLKLYAGPKDIGILTAAGNELNYAIDLGDWLGWIARPILSFLRWIHSVIPNYGLAIIILTVLVRLMMFPLSQMQAKSMKKMQQHKPQMDALKEKHKEDKETHSRELMQYMRTHRINPMGGCLLLLPQMPIFFALYRVLYNSIELRHAPFIFWIRDLAAHDPYFILPVLLGIAMFFQQKLTPSPTADPAQQTMMKIMPVMFTAFMLFLPAGLNLYILVSTLWGVGQQYWVQRDLAVATLPQKKASS